MGVRARSRLAADLTPRFPRRPWIPHVPHPPQQAFLLLDQLPEVFYGGAAGGGKSDAGLMAALQYADVPDYSALIIRRTYADLSLPGAIMDRATTWLEGRAGVTKRDGGTRWSFDTGVEGRPASLQFGYAQQHSDIRRYQSAEFQFIFFDELTHFEERTYLYAFSRLRGPALPCAHCTHPTSQVAGARRRHDEDHDWCECGHEHDPQAVCDAPDPIGRGGECGCNDYRPTGCECTAPEPDRMAVDATGRLVAPAAADGTTLADVPLRMRSGSNPGGVGHAWVRGRFVDPKTRQRSAVFVPAKIADNPSLDRRAYRASLQHLDAVELARLEDGDWDATESGDVFERGWFRIVDELPVPATWCRFWDFAATVPKPGKDPDWTVGTLMGLTPAGTWVVGDVVRFRLAPYETDKRMTQTAQLDGRAVRVRWEQEPGASGVKVTDGLRRMLPGFDADGVRSLLSKDERARPLAKAAQVGNVSILGAPWNREWLDELAGFPGLNHDDQVDSAAGAMTALTAPKRARIIS